jgi:hypothetical protein
MSRGLILLRYTVNIQQNFKPFPEMLDISTFKQIQYCILFLSLKKYDYYIVNCSDGHFLKQRPLINAE